MNPLISSLIENGNKLAHLIQQAESQSKSEDQTSSHEWLDVIHKEVGMVVHQVLEELESSKLPSSFPETIIPKLYEKILLTLQIFIKLDSTNASCYEELVKITNDSKSKHHTSTLGSSSSPLPLDHVPQHSESPSVGDSTQHEAFSNFADHQQEEDPFANLNEAEKNCLVCFCLFPAGKEIKKREPIHLWVGMGLIDSPSEGEDMLAKLVAEGFVERTVGNKRMCNRYRMNGTTRSIVIREFNIVNITPEGSSLTILEQQQQPPPQPQEASMSDAEIDRIGVTSMLGTLVLNESENTLGATTFEQLPKGKKGDHVLLLGSWDHNYERYIVLEDVDTLKALRTMRHVTCLSLQGVSGIVELPETIYKLESLKVLDLRACPNLESLSEGIDSLKQLTHLDMSECYLLDHIPQGISSLTKLRVLKGFVIVPEDLQVRNSRNEGIYASTSRASFSDLSKLEHLLKLTIHTRRMSFPTSEDLKTLSSMKVLTNLKLAWMSSFVDSPWPRDDDSSDKLSNFPASLKKLELQAAPQSSILRVLRLIRENAQIFLEKLYIRGGRQFDSCIEMRDVCHVRIVRLKYLPELRLDWDDFREIFPNLNRLEVSGCPNLMFFPCDENGVWEKTNIDMS